MKGLFDDDDQTDTTAQHTNEHNSAEAETPLHVELAAEALLDGWTREQVIDDDHQPSPS